MLTIRFATFSSIKNQTAFAATPAISLAICAGPPTTAAANATRPNVPIRVTLGKRIHLATNVVGGETRLRSDFGMLSAGCLK
jgi:hypothetical protein